MNEMNYASLEASKKLVEAGTVLETESVWYYKENLHVTNTDGSSPRKWQLIRTNTILFEKEKYLHPDFLVFAPSMAEVWRELPEEIVENKIQYWKVLSSQLEVAESEYASPIRTPIIHFENTNPTDALINLLIWIREREK